MTYSPTYSKRPTGYVLHESADYMVIATLQSDNRKTGDMIQIWILNRHESPVNAVRNGHDDTVCFDCRHRGQGFKNRTCYVNVGQGPRAVWQAYQDGSYPTLEIVEYARVFGGRGVRFGAYGEPVLIPLPIIRAVMTAAVKTTGYTHQWRRAEYAEYRAFLMASCDSVADYARAKDLGWRTFRVRTADAAVITHEIMCPASDEAGKRTQCVKCGLCNGATGSEDPRKDIVIIVHGAGAKNFVARPSTASLVSIEQLSNARPSGS